MLLVDVFTDSEQWEHNKSTCRSVIMVDNEFCYCSFKKSCVNSTVNSPHNLVPKKN